MEGEEQKKPLKQSSTSIIPDRDLPNKESPSRRDSGRRGLEFRMIEEKIDMSIINQFNSRDFKERMERREQSQPSMDTLTHSMVSRPFGYSDTVKSSNSV